MDFFTIITKDNIFVGDIVYFENGFYCVCINTDIPQILNEKQFEDFKKVIKVIYDYTIIKDGVNNEL